MASVIPSELLIRACERSVSGGTAERERSGERTKSAAPATAVQFAVQSESSRDTN